MTLNEICEKLGGEQVGGRVIVTHEGKKEYATDVNGATFYLNELGTLLMQQLQQVEVFTDPAPVRAPKRKKGAELGLSADDIQIDLE